MQVNEKEHENHKNKQHKQASIRNLISEISISNKPIVLHNGFIDLIFIYQNFYAKCPDNLMKFLADLEEV
jgi:target of EGR1 protein 1